MPDIIGKGGASIKAIQQHTGVKISTPSGYTKTSPSGETIVPSKVKISLAGSKDKVAQARNLILDLTKYYHTPVTHPDVTHVEMDIASHYYNYVIGAKGSEIKHIQANYKVSVYIPNDDSANPNLLIVGEESAVASAERHILKLIEKVDTQAAERAKAEAEGVALGESAKAKYAAAGTQAPSGGDRAERTNNAQRTTSGGGNGRERGGGGNSNRAPRADKDAKAEEPVVDEAWMSEFAPRRRGADLGAMLPASAKFAPAPTPAAAAAPVDAAADAAETTSAPADGTWNGLGSLVNM